MGNQTAIALDISTYIRALILGGTFGERVGLVRAARHVADLLQRLRVGLLRANARVNLAADDGNAMIEMKMKATFFTT